MYGEKRISVQNPGTEPGTIDKTEYRVWNPFRSKLAGTAWLVCMATVLDRSMDKAVRAVGACQLDSLSS